MVLFAPQRAPETRSVCQTSELKLEENNVRTTYMAKPGEVERKWYVVDATDVPLGRLSTVVASVLRGKNKPTFTPHLDTGDFVIVINADKVKLTGKKATDKIYYRHSNYPGGLKSITAGELRAKNSRRLIETSVKGMLPKKHFRPQTIYKIERIRWSRTSTCSTTTRSFRHHKLNLIGGNFIGTSSIYRHRPS